MRLRILNLIRANGLKLEASASFHDSWDDKKVMNFLVPLMRITHPVQEGDKFELQP